MCCYYMYLHNNFHNIVLLIIEDMVQSTIKDTSSEESESEVETCMVNSYKPLSKQSQSKFSKTFIMNEQKSVNRKEMRQKHAIMDDNSSDVIYSPKIKKRRSSKFVFISISYSFYKYFIYIYIHIIYIISCTLYMYYIIYNNIITHLLYTYIIYNII